MNKPIRLRNTFVSAFVLVALVALWLPTTEQNESAPDTALENDFVYFMENVSLIETNQSGTAYRWLESEKLVHFNDQHTELTQAKLRQKNLENNDEWQVSADAARLQDFETGELKGNVIVSQPLRQIILKTDRLQLDFNNQSMQTDHAVAIETPNLTMQAKGLQADFTEQRISLLSQVKGQYLAP